MGNAIDEQSVAKRIMIGIPMTGLLRAEWVIARYSQVIPCNWSQVDCIQWIETNAPMKHLVADARNIIATDFINREFEWLFFLDHDVVMPPTVILNWNDRMRKCELPMFSGLYFTKSYPSEPLIYRGRGNSFYDKWKLGDKVWVDGVPMGCTMIHKSLMKVLYDESETYEPKVGIKVKKIFETPSKAWFDPEQNSWHKTSGTEDLTLCNRIIKNGLLKKAGWGKLQRKKYPFLIDTSVFCRHIDWNGVQYPANREEKEFMRK